MVQIPLGVMLAAARDHNRSGRLGVAEDVCRAILNQDPAHPQARLLLATILPQRHGPNGVSQALEILKPLADAHRSTAEFHLALGYAMLVIQRWAEAEQAMEKTLSINPEMYEAMGPLGIAQRQLGKLDRSIATHRRAAELNPHHAEAHYNLGVALSEAHHEDAAAAAYAHACELEPDFAFAFYNLGNSLMRLRQWDRAADAYHAATRVMPGFADAYSNLGMALREAGRVNEAVAACDRAVELSPDLASPRWNRAQNRLALGEFANGWPEFDWRLKVHPQRPRDLQGARWAGEDVAGRTILLHWEMGLGDTLHLARYAPYLARRGAKVILDVQPEVRSLIGAVEGVDQVVCSLAGDALPPHDLHCSLLSVPAVLRVGAGPEADWANAPYLRADPALTRDWGDLLVDAAQRPRVGIAWAGNAAHQNDAERSLPKNVIAPLAAVTTVAWVSLQYGPRRSEIASGDLLPALDPMDRVSSLAETAAIIANLDLVITVDTAIAHLAGAMGKPVWILLAHSPDWRWGLTAETTRWYPSARLFRQEQRGDWDAVIRRVATALREFAPAEASTAQPDGGKPSPP
jgi:tetratricopeptide (TPR) repeat protein